MTKAADRLFSVSLTLLGVTAVALPCQARLLELTFDDGESGTGVADGHAELDNLEQRSSSLGEQGLDARLAGSAVRSGLHEGRYGRAADFPDGAGSVVVEGWETLPLGDLFASFWVRARSDSAGNLLEREGTFAVRLADGEVVLEASGDPLLRPTGAFLPADGSFHHVAVTVQLGGGSPTFMVAVDFDPTAGVELPLEPAGEGAAVIFGAGLDGLIDEILVTEGSPDEADLFDFDPDHCPAGLECLEEVITTVPRDFPHEVPVRFKSVYRPDLCTEAVPCPLLFDISGGNNCADDYATPGSVRALADEGFLVVTVDLYCEGDADTSGYPTETSQLIAAKDFLLSSSEVTPRIEGDDYRATGCSHGAGTVTGWALFEADHPSATYARSAGIDGHCALHAGVLCPAVAEYAESRVAEGAGPHDDEDPRARAFHERSNTPDVITAELAASQDIALSWGLNLEGPVCTAEGRHACNEEGQWGMTYGARRFRDVWQRLQPVDRPTGYFVEDHGADCRHCAPPGSVAFACGVCLLAHGRAGMASECPSCLDYDDPDITAGGEAESCPIDASWYQDPLFGPGEPAADGGTGGDAGAVDAGLPHDDPGADSSGCSCSTVPTLPGRSSPVLAAVALALALALRRTTARRGR